MTRARDKASAVVANFASTGIDDNADANAITIDSIGQAGLSGSSNSFDTTGSVNGLQLYYESDAGLATIGSYSGGGSTNLSFHTNSGGSASTERFRITANGDTFNGDTAAANSLSDYEEGTLNLGVTTGTASFNFTRYTKVGSICTFGLLINNFSDTSSSSAIIITGLPFASASNMQAMGSTIITGVNSGRENFVSYISQSSSLLSFYASGNNSAYVSVTHAMLSGSEQIFLTLTYQTA
jgi:hypothetical protein